MNEPQSHNITELPNGDIVYEDSIWWSFDSWKNGKQKPISTNWDAPVNLRLVFDNQGNLKSAEKL